MERPDVQISNIYVLNTSNIWIFDIVSKLSPVKDYNVILSVKHEHTSLERLCGGRECRWEEEQPDVVESLQGALREACVRRYAVEHQRHVPPVRR